MTASSMPAPISQRVLEESLPEPVPVVGRLLAPAAPPDGVAEPDALGVRAPGVRFAVLVAAPLVGLPAAAVVVPPPVLDVGEPPPVLDVGEPLAVVGLPPVAV
jgi:hypothetical protein